MKSEKLSKHLSGFSNYFKAIGDTEAEKAFKSLAQTIAKCDKGDSAEFTRYIKDGYKNDSLGRKMKDLQEKCVHHLSSAYKGKLNKKDFEDTLSEMKKLNATQLKTIGKAIDAVTSSKKKDEIIGAIRVRVNNARKSTQSAEV